MSENKKTVDVGGVIDSAKYFGLPFAITLMMVVIMLTDGFDLFTMGYVGPHIISDWGITRVQLGPINTAGMLGMAVGSVTLGWAGDRIGRKKAYFTCLAFLFLGSILCYYAQSVATLTTFRFVTGLGLGGITPLATTLISEWTPKRVRSVVVASVIVAVPFGGTLTGLIADWLIPLHGWRVMFLVGAIVPLVLFAAFSLILPESPKYLALRPAQHGRLAALLNRLVGEKRFDGTENFIVAEGAKTSSNWFSTIWNSQYWRSTLFLWMAFAFNTLVLYVFTNYLPTLLDYANQTAAVASRGLQLFSLGGLFGSIGGAFLMGYLGSRYVGSIAAFIGALAVAGVGILLVQPGEVPIGQVLALCLVGGTVINGMQAYLYAVGANAYPTEIRGAAIGMAQTFSRLGGVLSASVPTAYFAMQPVPSIDKFFLFVAGCALVTTVSYFLIATHIPARGK
jgi:AAHS family 4-hydroxybenzoate transporter-like MFS transporter